MQNARTRKPRPAVRSESHDWGDIHTGTREDLLAAGLLREEWIPVKVRKNERVKTDLADGRSVRVYTKGARLEVWIRETEHERSRREQARRAARMARYAQVAISASYLQAVLPALWQTLRKRYPTLRVIPPRYECDPNDELRQCLAFQGPVEQLIACGLLTPAMLQAYRDHWRDRRTGRKIHRTTPLGCHFTLWEEEGNPDAILTIYSSVAPAGPDRFVLDDARRELARIFTRPRP